MITENRTTNVSEVNPLLGVHTFLSAVVSGRFSKNGIEMAGAADANKISLDILNRNR